MLLHEPQGETRACMYHATYALTHDAVWLAYARDGPGDPTLDVTWQRRLAEHGILLFAHHVTQRAYAAPAGRDFWLWLRAHAHGISPGELPLLLTTCGGTLYHTVAALIDTTSGTVSVSDSCAAALQPLTWGEFLDSAYARAYRVEMLMTLSDDSPG